MRKEFAVNLNHPLKVNNAVTPFFSGNRCFLCSSPGKNRETICRACLKDLAFNTDACPACAKPDSASSMCSNCLNRKRAFIDNSWALFRYHYPVNLLIQHIKFNQGIDIANYLGFRRETLSRSLKGLQKLGMIRVSGKKVSILDRDKLRHLAVTTSRFI